jgi:HemY protein
MARIEAAEHGDTGLAREWMARAVHAAHDPVWTADGVIAEAWMPVSPVSGRLDAFQWRVPVADLTPRGPTVEQTQQPLPLPVSPEPSPVPAAAQVTETPLKPSLGLVGRPYDLSPHAPDDPGPAPDRPSELVPRSGRSKTGKTRSWFSRAAVK